MEISIEVSGGVAATHVPEDVATDLQATYEALAKLPNNRVAVVDFGEAKEARLFCKQGRAWAESTIVDGQPLTFSRRGDVKANPRRVSFRIYRPATQEEKAAKAAEREAKASKPATGRKDK
jgi:hypothetical protein